MFEDLPWEGEGRGCFEDGMVEEEDECEAYHSFGSGEDGEV